LTPPRQLDECPGIRARRRGSDEEFAAVPPARRRRGSCIRAGYS